MIQLYCGDGKGKTTAAIGQAVRAAGSGLKVIFSQFMKGNDTGELHALCQIKNIEIMRSPKDFGFFSNLSEEEKQELTEIHNEILDWLLPAAKSGDCDMIILDEITYPVSFHLIDESKLRELLSFGHGREKTGENAGKETEIILTGRSPADFMMDQADYVTEMRAVRHPFEKGIAARKGIEY